MKRANPYFKGDTERQTTNFLFEEMPGPEGGILNPNIEIPNNIK